MDKAFDHSKIRVYPVASRRSLSRLDRILLNPNEVPTPCSPAISKILDEAVGRIIQARRMGASVILIYGAHLIKNGLMDVVIRLIEGGWVTHLATNGAGSIHDWEFAYLGCTEESVRENIPKGIFGTWDETGRYIHLALMVGALDGLGFGQSLGRFIADDGANVPQADKLEELIRQNPWDDRVGAWSDLLRAIKSGWIKPGENHLHHVWKEHSLLNRAWQLGIPLTVHPGIGYDIITNHPMFNGAVLGRAAAIDFDLLASSIDRLDNGVVLSVGTAVMGPQVFEKAISCVNNVRLNENRPIVSGHSIFVVDIQDSGGWDWSTGEPPKSSPAYYLRFCKSYARAADKMVYAQCSNTMFLHNLWWRLREKSCY